MGRQTSVYRMKRTQDNAFEGNADGELAELRRQLEEKASAGNGLELGTLSRVQLIIRVCPEPAFSGNQVQVAQV